MSALVRKLTNKYQRLGYLAKSGGRQAKLHPIEFLEVYPSPTAFSQATGVWIEGEAGQPAILTLTGAASLELVKGLLMNQLRSPIGMTADDEFREILAQVQAAIAGQDEESRQVVQAVRATVESK